MCQPHWDRLRQAVETRGLGHLIASNDREAHARVVADLKGEGDPVADFDPLMTAHNMIWSRALNNFGLGIMGDYCPACELVKQWPEPPAGHRYATNELYFIDGPADAVLDMAREAGIDKPLRSADVEGGAA